MRPVHRWFLALGTACVVAGGLVSAVTAAAPSEHASWAVAYLVLVGGVAQVGLGAGHLLLGRSDQPPRAAVAELWCWNVGNAAVLAGVLGDATALVDVGGALLVVALAVAVDGVRGARGAEGARGARGVPGERRGWPLQVFRILVLVLLVSIPVGLVLARTGSG